MADTGNLDFWCNLFTFKFVTLTLNLKTGFSMDNKMKYSYIVSRNNDIKVNLLEVMRQIKFDSTRSNLKFDSQTFNVKLKLI